MTYIKVIERRIQRRLVRVIQFHEFYTTRQSVTEDRRSLKQKHVDLKPSLFTDSFAI